MQKTSPPQKKKKQSTNQSSEDRINPSLSFPHQRKNTQANKQKLSINLTLLYEAYTNH